MFFSNPENEEKVLEGGDKDEKEIHDLEKGVHTGVAVNTDGNTYRLPSMDTKFVEKEDYIPDEYARGKIHRAAEEYEYARNAFESRIRRIQEYHMKLQSERESAFQEHCKEMKAKAMRHVEVQRKLKQQMEEKLTTEIRIKEDQIQALNDNTATLTETNKELEKAKMHLNEEIATLTRDYAIMESKLGVEDVLGSVGEVS